DHLHALPQLGGRVHVPLPLLYPAGARDLALLLRPARTEGEDIQHFRPHRFPHRPGLRRCRRDPARNRGGADMSQTATAKSRSAKTKSREQTMTTSSSFGVHSEVGQLRKVMVCAPGRAHQRITPSNCDALLFDDVLWVEVAMRDHFDFVTKLRDRGVEVVEMHNLLAETLALPEARAWILDHEVVPNEVGLDLVDVVRSYLDGLPPR